MAAFATAQRREDAMPPATTPAQYFIVHSDGEWKIKFRNEMFGPYRSRDEALLFAIDAAKRVGERESAAQVLVEDANDRFLTKWTYREPARMPAA